MKCTVFFFSSYSTRSNQHSCDQWVPYDESAEKVSRKSTERTKSIGGNEAGSVEGRMDAILDYRYFSPVSSAEIPFESLLSLSITAFAGTIPRFTSGTATISRLSARSVCDTQRHHVSACKFRTIDQSRLMRKKKEKKKKKQKPSIQQSSSKEIFIHIYKNLIANEMFHICWKVLRKSTWEFTLNTPVTCVQRTGRDWKSESTA